MISIEQTSKYVIIIVIDWMFVEGWCFRRFRGCHGKCHRSCFRKLFIYLFENLCGVILYGLLIIQLRTFFLFSFISKRSILLELSILLWRYFKLFFTRGSKLHYSYWVVLQLGVRKSIKVICSNVWNITNVERARLKHRRGPKC